MKSNFYYIYFEYIVVGWDGYWMSCNHNCVWPTANYIVIYIFWYFKGTIFVPLFMKDLSLPFLESSFIIIRSFNKDYTHKQIKVQHKGIVTWKHNKLVFKIIFLYFKSIIVDHDHVSDWFISFLWLSINWIL